MPQAKSWIFTQLTGQKKAFQLTGQYAPYGRPRQRPVVTDGIELRESAVYYDGSDSPTRLIFGTKEFDWELTGRFLDFHFGVQGGAKKKALELKQFCADQQPISIRWGDILSCTGLIKSVKFPREAENDIRYEIVLLIDNDDQLSQVAVPSTAISPDIAIQQAQLYVSEIALPADPALPIKPSFLDAIDSLVSAINSPFAALAGVCNQISSIEKALTADLLRISFGCQQVKTAVLNLRDQTDTTLDSAVTVLSTGDSQTQWAATKANIDVSTNLLLALLADLNHSAVLALRGKTQTGVQALTGDTWESLSTRVYGNANGVSKLRDANGIKYGQQPIAGKRYHVPQ